MKKWTNEEIKILQDNYQTKCCQNLCDILPNRTWCAIKQEAKKLGLLYVNSLRDEQRFWTYVGDKQEDNCWNWIGIYDRDGYGHIKINRKQVIAHRFSWVLKNGEIPKNMYVLHRCDNPKCVNPSHLFLGTQQDNIKDKVNKNRQSSKLTISQVKQIRNFKGKFTQKEIAKMFDVDSSTVGYIHRNKTWRHTE